MFSKNTVYVRGIPVGGNSPVVIQSMSNVDARDEEGILEQIKRLDEAGCSLVRLAVPDKQGLEVFSRVRKQTEMPLICDIHFDYRLAIGAVNAGADKIRINPGNIGSEDRVKKVVEACKSRGVPIRIGVNSGSVEKDILKKYGHVCAEALSESAVRNVELVRNMDFDDIVLSIKSSDVRMNYEAHQLTKDRVDCPFHIGITEAGTPKHGKRKSAAGLGALLLSGIGDTMRVSLTADPVEEVIFAKGLLEDIGMRKPKLEMVSCPTCGRTRVNVEELADRVEQRLLSEDGIPEGLKVCVMGCVVNGPGEAKEADYGICGGDGKGAIIVRGRVVETAPESELVDRLVDIICKEVN